MSGTHSESLPGLARVVVDIALDREFDYSVPESLRDRIRVGSRVLLPFGTGQCHGYVVDLPALSGHSGRLKDVLSIVGEKPYIDERMLALARWMADYYCSPVEKAVRTVLPAAVRRRGATFKEQMAVTLTTVPAVSPVTPPDATRIPGTPLTDAPPPKGDRMSPKQLAVLDLLQSRGGSMLLTELLKEAGTTVSPVRSLQARGWVTIEPASVRRNPLLNRTILRTEPLTLMPEQASALAQIKDCMDAPTPEASAPPSAGASRVTLLYGVTGSGKTEVYLQAIAHGVAQGKGAIVLVPEIALTPQTVERFASRFGDRIAVLHSHLSDGERHDEWHRIRDGKADIVVGARSAVFAPVRNLGLIVVDEEHEPSYKQEDPPQYNARDVAVMRARMENCAVVLGSATPCLESWANAKSGKYRLAILPHRADHRTMPVMQIVDMRREMSRLGRPTSFSQDLIEAIRRRLDRAEQTMLFINRRGFATSLVCPRCGHVANCEHCSVAYTYHRVGDELRCHICGTRKPVPSLCPNPNCKDPAFKYSGMGTQRVEDVITRCFPKARVQRMDADITTRKEAYERILGDFRTGKIDILIGTQMIAKGLHFPNVTLVGVVYADLSLHIPDFRAGERTFQLLAQVAGRAGRGDVSGEVIVQTYTPHNPAIQAARRLDFEGFCDQELEFRKELNYPPTTHLTCITVRAPDDAKARFCAAALWKEIRTRLEGKALISEPCAAPLARARGLFRHQIMIRARAMKPVSAVLKDLLRTFKVPKGVSFSVDVDALSLL